MSYEPWPHPDLSVVRLRDDTPAIAYFYAEEEFDELEIDEAILKKINAKYERDKDPDGISLLVSFDNIDQDYDWVERT